MFTYLLTYLLCHWTVSAVRSARSFVGSSGQMLLPRYLMNGLISLAETILGIFNSR